MYLRKIRNPSDPFIAWHEAMYAAERELGENGQVLANIRFFRRRGPTYSEIFFTAHGVRDSTLQYFKLQAIAKDVILIIVSGRASQVYGKLQPSVTATQNDRRDECVTVVALMREDDTGKLVRHLGNRVIERDADGTVSRSQGWVSYHNNPTPTILDDLLPPQLSTAEEQKVARATLRLMLKEVSKTVVPF